MNQKKKITGTNQSDSGKLLTRKVTNKQKNKMMNFAYYAPFTILAFIVTVGFMVSTKPADVLEEVQSLKVEILSLKKLIAAHEARVEAIRRDLIATKKFVGEEE